MMDTRPEFAHRRPDATAPVIHNAAVVCSVVVGRVSTREGARIFEFLAAMRRQIGGIEREVIVADRINDELSGRIAAEFPEVTLIACPRDTTLPAMRATALARARGTYVAVTEDHCVPSDDWLASIVAAFRDAPAGVAAVGGSVDNGLPERLLDRATFQCEYGKYVAPVVNGVSEDLPGMNIAYVREQLRALDPDLLTRGFWETTVHARLHERGLVMLSSDRIRLTHRKHIGFLEFIQQRYWYSRYFAGQRFATKSMAQRALAVAAAPALPAILVWRFHRAALRHPGYGGEFVATLPLLTAFAVVWAAGEIVGSVFGEGDSLRKLE